jgi:hypothetical protein
MVFSEHMSENTNVIKISTETVLQAAGEAGVNRYIYPSLISVIKMKYRLRISQQ